MSFWFRDIISEGTFLGDHTLAVQKGLNLGIILFIVSEALFFLAIFWAFFHSALTPTVELGAQWPPLGIEPVNPFELPLLNTVILLSSGATVTYAHHSLIHGERKGALYGSIATILLVIIFTIFQGIEYRYILLLLVMVLLVYVSFLYGFFHGFHVIVGTIFLSVALWRTYAYYLTDNHHVGFRRGNFVLTLRRCSLTILIYIYILLGFLVNSKNAVLRALVVYINLNYEYFLSIITGIVVPLDVNFSSNDNGSPNNSRNPDRNNNSENHENPSSNPNDNVQGSDPRGCNDQENGDPYGCWSLESGDPMDVDENNNNDEEEIDYYGWGKMKKILVIQMMFMKWLKIMAPKQVLKDLATLNEAKRNNNPEALNEIKKQYEQFF